MTPPISTMEGPRSKRASGISPSLSRPAEMARGEERIVSRTCSIRVSVSYLIDRLDWRESRKVRWLGEGYRDSKVIFVVVAAFTWV